MKEILLTRWFLTDVMRVQLDNTKQNLYICAKRASLKNYSCFETDFGKILLDKDSPFFCPPSRIWSQNSSPGSLTVSHLRNGAEISHINPRRNSRQPGSCEEAPSLSYQSWLIFFFISNMYEQT